MQHAMAEHKSHPLLYFAAPFASDEIGRNFMEQKGEFLAVMMLFSAISNCHFLLLPHHHIVLLTRETVKLAIRWWLPVGKYSTTDAAIVVVPVGRWASEAAVRWGWISLHLHPPDFPRI